MELGKIDNDFQKAQVKLIEKFAEFHGKEHSLEDFREFLDFIQKHIKAGVLSERTKYVLYIRKIQKQCAGIINKAGRAKLSHVKLDINAKDLKIYQNLHKVNDTNNFARSMKKKFVKVAKKPAKKSSKKSLSGINQKRKSVYKFLKEGGSINDLNSENITYSDRQIHDKQSPIIYSIVEIKKLTNKADLDLKKGEYLFHLKARNRNIVQSGGSNYFAYPKDLYIKEESNLGCPGKKKCGCEMHGTEEYTTPVISKAQAKKIASDWHKGQWDKLYSFASTGEYLDDFFADYLMEIESNFKRKTKLKPAQEKQLKALKNFFVFKHHERSQDLKGLGNTPSCLEPRPKKLVRLSGSDMKGLGFVSADNRSQVEQPGSFKLKGEVGKLLGTIQPYKYAIVLTGDPEAGKTEFVTQVANEFIDADFDVAFFSLEQGGMESKLTTDAIDRNVTKANQKRLFVTGEGNIESIKAATKKFKVIIVDSFGKLGVPPMTYFDKMREEYPETIWIFIFQQTGEGTVRGGSAVSFDSPVVLKVHKPDTSFVKNWVELIKNRGNNKDLHYKMKDRKTYPGHEPKSN